MGEVLERTITENKYLSRHEYPITQQMGERIKAIHTRMMPSG